jgi:hypothetical protein
MGRASRSKQERTEICTGTTTLEVTAGASKKIADLSRKTGVNGAGPVIQRALAAYSVLVDAAAKGAKISLSYPDGSAFEISLVDLSKK